MENLKVPMTINEHSSSLVTEIAVNEDVQPNLDIKTQLQVQVLDANNTVNSLSRQLISHQSSTGKNLLVVEKDIYHHEKTIQQLSTYLILMMFRVRNN